MLWAMTPVAGKEINKQKKARKIAA